MKKVVLLAAVAMLAFASCNKEENQVRLNFGGEPYADADKQAYEANRVLFTAGDHILINGEDLVLAPRNNGRQAVCEASPADTFYVFYGGATVAANHTATIEFKSEVTGIPESYTVLNNTIHNPWPMSAVVTDASRSFTLLHNVSVFSAGCKLGMDFINYMWGANGRQAQVWAEGDELPVIRFKRATIECPTRKITGTATMQVVNEDGEIVEEPSFTVRNAAPNGNMLTVNILEEGNSNVVPLATASNYGDRYFNVPFPVMTSNSLQFNITYYFEATINGQTYAFNYSAPFTTTPVNRFHRAIRLDLKCNLYDQEPGNWNHKINF